MPPADHKSPVNPADAAGRDHEFASPTRFYVATYDTNTRLPGSVLISSADGPGSRTGRSVPRTRSLLDAPGSRRARHDAATTVDPRSVSIIGGSIRAEGDDEGATTDVRRELRGGPGTLADDRPAGAGPDGGWARSCLRRGTRVGVWRGASGEFSPAAQNVTRSSSRRVNGGRRDSCG